MHKLRHRERLQAASGHAVCGTAGIQNREAGVVTQKAW